MMTNQPKGGTIPTAWTEFLTPEASTDRGWLKAICTPWDFAHHSEYTDENMPVFDADINDWREQCTLGNYLDYGPCRPWATSEQYPDGLVHCVCYAAHTARYVRTVAEARAWIEAESLRVRPELAIQAQLFDSLSPVRKAEAANA